MHPAPHTRWPSTIRTTRVVAAAPGRLWEVISAPGHLEVCHPFCAANPVVDWPGAASRDVIEYYGGRVVNRGFTAWEDGAGYDLVVATPDGDEQARVWWRVEPAGEASSRLAITLVQRFAHRRSPLLRLLAYGASNRQMQKYLRSVVDGVAFHAATGEGVHRNQFGAHRWFSP